MFVQGLTDLCANAIGASKGAKELNKSDPTTLGIVFMAFACAVLPLDISQLAFAILGAVLYAVLQKNDKSATKKPSAPTTFNATPYQYAAYSQKAQSSPTPSAKLPKPLGRGSVAPPAAKPEVRVTSVKPIVAPTFQGKDWESEIQELLAQITPTAEGDLIVKKLARMIQQTIRKVIPEAEVSGFASGNLHAGKAFGVAVPQVDIVASVDPRVLFERLHGRSAQTSTAQLDAKKLQKCAIRTCTDRLVAAGGFKFRRSAFRGQEPKVTLLAPSSLGLFEDSIAIDFSVNVVTPLYNAALLTECGQIDSRTKELILLVKRWAKDRGICHAAKGHLPPYLWGILTMYFLQVREESLLPPLDEFKMSAGLLTNQRTERKEKWSPPQSGETKSTASLFKEFVHFFQAEFDWKKEAVSIRAGERAPPSLELPLHIMVSDDSASSQVGPSIEDPFESAQNLADGMSIVSYARLKEELLRADTLCVSGASLSELLEPWVPPESETVESAVKQETSAVPRESPMSRAGPRNTNSPATGRLRLTGSLTGSLTGTTTTLAPPWRRTGSATQ